MDDVIPQPPLNFSNRYLQGSRRMPNYRYQCNQTYNTVPAFLASRRLSKSQFIPIHAAKCPPSKSVPIRGKGPCAPPYSPPDEAGYQPRSVAFYPEPCQTKHPKSNVTPNPMQPSEGKYPQQYMAPSPYSGMTKGPHGAINKGSPPRVTSTSLPCMTKGPLLYPNRSSPPYVIKGAVPRMTKGPVLYSAKGLLPGMTKGVTKGPVLYSSKGLLPVVTNGSQLNMTKGKVPSAAKGTLPRATKGPRLIATKVPRLGLLNASRSFLRKGSRRLLTKGSQPSLAKGSRPSLAKGSHISLAKGSQPSLGRTCTSSATPKLSKNVKIASTGMKYCSATKWPF